MSSSSRCFSILSNMCWIVIVTLRTRSEKSSIVGFSEFPSVAESFRKIRVANSKLTECNSIGFLALE